MARTGRRPGASPTRARIAEAATAAFAASGFDGATIRGIARRAGVDPALVHHYFGSKEQLFVATMQLPFEPARLSETLASGGIDGAGQRIMQFAVGIWEQQGLRPVLQGLARSAASDRRAAAMVRDLLEAVLVPAIRGLGVDQPELRAAVLWSQIIGVVFGRFVVEIDELRRAEPDVLVALLAPALQTTLTGRLPDPGVSQASAV